MLYMVYMLLCADGTFYTGSTNNLEKRMAAHNGGKTGARYTRGRRPVMLAYIEKGFSRGEALKREAALKSLSKDKKKMLCQ